MNVLAYHLTCVHFLTRINEELAAILQLVDRVSIGCAGLERNHRTVHTACNLALVRLVLLEAVGHDSLALARCEHVGAQTDNAARRYIELDVYAVAEGLHRCHLALAACHHINHLARELLGHVDSKFLDRLALHTVDLLVDYLRLTYLKLVTLATHCLDKHREVEHTASAYDPLVG